MRLTADDLKEINLFKYYRLVRKWACKTYGLKDADLELLIFLDCQGHFTIQGFKDGEYIHSWDKDRWERLRRDGWIDVDRFDYSFGGNPSEDFRTEGGGWADDQRGFECAFEDCVLSDGAVVVETPAVVTP